LGQLKLALPLILILTISFAPVFADTSGDLSVVSGKTYQIHYQVKDSQVQTVQVNKESLSLVFLVQATSSNAYLQLTLPRELIDATKSDGTDDVFIILVDGTFATYVEKSASSLDRTLLIQLAPSDKEIEIIGTHLAETTLTPQKNNTHSTPSQITTPTKPVEQKSIENKTVPQTPNQPTASQPTSTESQAKSIQEQILQQISSLLHFKSGYLPLEISKKQIVEYSIIAAIILVIIIAIASSARSKNKKQIRK